VALPCCLLAYHVLAGIVRSHCRHVLAVCEHGFRVFRLPLWLRPGPSRSPSVLRCVRPIVHAFLLVSDVFSAVIKVDHRHYARVAVSEIREGASLPHINMKFFYLGFGAW
jgi:hypothetical protein